MQDPFWGELYACGEQGSIFALFSCCLGPGWLLYDITAAKRVLWSEGDRTSVEELWPGLFAVIFQVSLPFSLSQSDVMTEMTV